MTLVGLEAPDRVDQSEYHGRLDRLHVGMRKRGLDAVVLTGEANLRWITGWAPRIYLSAARPWFAVLPVDGDPQLVLPEMGMVEARRESWIANLASWPSPRPGDEGVSLLTKLLLSLPRRFGSVGFELGPHTRLGMPCFDFQVLKANVASAFQIVDAGGLLQGLRMRKSRAEITLVRAAIDAAQAAFDATPAIARTGITEHVLSRRFQAEALKAGADSVPYVAVASGPGGYDSIVRGPSARCLAKGDVLGIDTGTVVGGYFADFNRNFSIGTSPEADQAHRLLWQALEAGIAALRPGAKASDIWRAMAHCLPDGGGEAAGRMGHGVGLEYTELPSVHPDDQTTLTEGMLLALEPSLCFAGMDSSPRFMALEENVWLAPEGPILLTRRAPERLPCL